MPDAPALLRKHLETNNKTYTDIACEVGTYLGEVVDRATTSSWARGHSKPILARQKALEVLTGGEVPQSAWLKSRGKSGWAVVARCGAVSVSSNGRYLRGYDSLGRVTGVAKGTRDPQLFACSLNTCAGRGCKHENS